MNPRELGDDDGAWLVYADELQRDGDPRGELIAIQHRLATDPDDAAARERENELFEAYADYLIGPLGAWEPIGSVPMHGIQLAWRHGFVRRMHVRKELPDLAAVLRHPSFQLLDTLWLAEPQTGREQDYAGHYVGPLVEAGELAALRDLTIGPEIERHSSWAGPGYVYIDVDISAQWLHALGPLWKLLPNLERLAVYGNHVDFGTLTLPALRTFEHVTSSLGRSELHAIDRATWPLLERLEIWFGDGEYGGGNCSVRDVMELVTRLPARTPALRELAIANCPFVDELCGVLGGAPILRQLRLLDVSHGNLGRRGIAALAKLVPAMPELRTLNVAASPIEDAALGKLRSAAPHVELQAGRLAGPQALRFCRVSE